MGTNTDRHFRTLIWGVFSLAVGAACLFVAASFDAQLRGVMPQRDAEALSPLELAGTSNLLMSCADDATQQQRPGAEPMWCSNPDSPHCLPALPKPPAPDATHGPVATVLCELVRPQSVAVVLLMAWPTPWAEHTRSLQLSHRLERPPRSV